MKVVHISALERGGAANGCIGLHLGLLEEGIDSTMLVAQKSRTDIEACHPLYQNRLQLVAAKARNKLWGRKSHKIRGLPRGYERYSFPHSSHRPENSPFVKSADIVNLHWVAEFVNYPTFFNRIKQPIVWTLHDMNPFSGGIHFAKGFPLEPYSTFSDANTALKTRLLRNKNIHVVSPSKWLANESARSLPFKEFPHHVIPYGVDTETFRLLDVNKVRAELGINTSRKTLLFVAARAQNKRKGLDILLEALKQPVLKDQFTLIVAGITSDSLDIVEDSVLLGQVAGREKMASVYAAADLFVTPAIEDNLPNTVIESLCCGTPVVAFSVGGMPDMISPGENGLLCDESDSSMLADTINTALNMSFDRNHISSQARSRYNPAVQANAYLELYQKILS